jgi:hypothetical protein
MGAAKWGLQLAQRVHDFRDFYKLEMARFAAQQASTLRRPAVDLGDADYFGQGKTDSARNRLIGVPLHVFVKSSRLAPIRTRKNDPTGYDYHDHQSEHRFPPFSIHTLAIARFESVTSRETLGFHFHFCVDASLATSSLRAARSFSRALMRASFCCCCSFIASTSTGIILL